MKDKIGSNFYVQNCQTKILCIGLVLTGINKKLYGVSFKFHQSHKKITNTIKSTYQSIQTKIYLQKI